MTPDPLTLLLLCSRPTPAIPPDLVCSGGKEIISVFPFRLAHFQRQCAARQSIPTVGCVLLVVLIPLGFFVVGAGSVVLLNPKATSHVERQSVTLKAQQQQTIHPGDSNKIVTSALLVTPGTTQVSIFPKSTQRITDPTVQPQN